MGNFVGSSDNMPSYFSHHEVKELTTHLNSLFQYEFYLLQTKPIIIENRHGVKNQRT